MNSEELRSEALALARQTRSEKRLYLKPIGDIFEFLSSENIFVVEIPVEDGMLSGCFYYDRDTNQPWVMINTSNTLGRQRFTAAHEFCHFLKHRDMEFIVCENMGGKVKPPHEKFADFFAGEFLLPSEALKKEISLNSSIGPAEVLTICLKYGVSYAACLRGLVDNNYISEPEYKILIEFTDFKRELLGLKKVKRAVGGDLFMPTLESISTDKLPSKYLKLALELYKKKLITRAKLTEYLEIDLPALELILKNR